MKYFSASTGVGGFDLGVPSDWECVGMSEIDKYANMVLKYRWLEIEDSGTNINANIEVASIRKLEEFELEVKN